MKSWGSFWPALTLSHGNAVPERGFSINNSLLSKERLGIGEKTLVAERIVKEAVRIFGDVTATPITKELVAFVKKSHAEYEHELEMEKEKERKTKEEQRQQTQLTEGRKTVLARQDAIKKQINEQQILEDAELLEQETARELIQEATSKLAASLKNSDLKGAKVAQAMLTAGNEQLQKTSKHLNEIREQKIKCNEKLSKIEVLAGDEPPKKMLKK